MSYSTKIVKKEFSGQIVRAVKLNPVTSSLTTFKLLRGIAPSLGSAIDGVLSQDRTMMFSSMLNILAMNLTSDEHDQLQILLLGGLLNSNDEPLVNPEAINNFLEANPNLNIYTLLAWRFETELMQPLLDSEIVQNNLHKLETVKNMFSDMFAELPEATPEEVIEDAESK